MLPILLPCLYCQSPHVGLDGLLLVADVQAVLAEFGEDGVVAGQTAALEAHRRHLEARQLSLSQTLVPPPPTASSLGKTRYVEEVLFREITQTAQLSVEDLPPESQLAKTGVRGKLASVLLKAIQTEALITGEIAKQQVKGKRAAERELAGEEAALEAVLTPEEQLRYFMNTLRLHGYTVAKEIEAADAERTWPSAQKEATDGQDAAPQGRGARRRAPA